MFGFGLFLMTLGLFEKMVLADSFLSPAADAVFGTHQPLGTLDAWIGILAFSGQIFCDFAGYTTCAIGAALCFGIALPDNFRFPYAAIGFSDFWRRWHISLSRWLRDYLYVPLGGNRKGPIRTHVNLMLTMLIGGLWHGASWNFVIWGGIHGFYLLLERLIRRFVPRIGWFETGVGQLLLALVTFFLVCITWIFFRSKDLDSSLAMLGAAFGFGGGAPMLPTQDIVLVLGTITGLLATHWALRHRGLEDWLAHASQHFLTGIWIVMLAAILLAQGTGDAFIYFQF
jgi:alginate O-acetyltransferase complex protein AlgI